MPKLYGCPTPTFKSKIEYEETLGGECAKFMKQLGKKPMEWQELALNDILSLTPDNELMNMIAAMSIPRQNGKTFLIACICAFALVQMPYFLGVNTLRILYTSHRVTTNNDIYNYMLEMFDNEEEYPELWKFTHPNGNSRQGNGIKRRNGNEGIECKWTDNGEHYKTELVFSARSKNAARGSSVDIIIFDEAQELTEDQAAAIMPTGAASKKKQLIIQIGTPNYELCAGTVFKRLRKNCMEKDIKGRLYMEWGITEITDNSDRKLWAQTNPSLGHLINADFIEAVEYSTMSELDFARERLGYWSNTDSLGIEHPINQEDWERCINKNPGKGEIKCIGVKFTPNASDCAVSICVKNGEEYHIELLQVFSTHKGLDGLITFLTDFKKSASQILIDSKSTSYDVQQRLLHNKVSKSCIIIANTGDMANANVMLKNSVIEKSITHFDQEQLNDAVCKCKKRVIGSQGLWGFEDNEDGYAFIVESAALALYSCKTTKRNPKRRGRIA